MSTIGTLPAVRVPDDGSGDAGRARRSASIRVAARGTGAAHGGQQAEDESPCSILRMLRDLRVLHLERGVPDAGRSPRAIWERLVAGQETQQPVGHLRRLQVFSAKLFMRMS
jgi:hypothetical protein